MKSPVLLLLILLSVLMPAHADTSRVTRFDVEVSDAPAKAFFQGLTEGTGQNMLVHPEVSGRVSFSLKQVTVEEVLNAARDLYGYDWRRSGNAYMVLPANIQTRIYHLNYLDLQRYGVSKTRISSGQVTQGANSQYSNGAVTGGGSSSGGGEEKDGKPSVDISGTAIETRNDSDFWLNIEANLRAMLGEKADRSVVVNHQSGLIVVRAMPSEQRDISDYLQRISDTVTRQVVLEAKIVEVELSDAYQAGINWASIVQNGGSHYFTGQTAPNGGFGVDPFRPTNDNVIVGPNNPIAGIVNSTLGGAFTIAADFKDFNAFIELLGVQGQTHVLSSPRVSTLHNQKAIIKAGTDEFFVTGVKSNTTTGTATTTTKEVDLTPFFSGVALDVTPQISEDDNVILHIHPTVSEVTDQTKTLTMSGTTDTLPLAISQIRESDNIVRARSGQLIVIGGLMRQNRKNQNYKTPLLGDIPLVGKLFRSEHKSYRTVELVILLRPIVVNDSNWPTLVAEPTDRIEEMKKQGHLQ
ncbi:MAG TPA: pilus (MSHA type) biogenesis protein MshL [Steroidobacteraceae bacterium]|nr:pilus (MSHA type) biogenesis protein MshL [Steroidobacteraceae bacterium]